MESNSNYPWHHLFDQDPEITWQNFINKYNDLILAVISRMTHDHDEKMELYTYTLEKLKEENFKKLKAYFEKTRPYDFSTWLVIVIRNCCSDWLRREKGRKRLLKCIKDLPALDQWIFRYLYWQKYSYDISYELVKTKHGFKGSFGDFCAHVDQIDEMLQNNMKLRLTESLHFIKSLPPAENIENEVYQLEATKNNSNHHSSQEDQIISSDRTEIIKDVLNQIPPEEQLIIKLRFFRGLPLDQIARLLKMKNLWRVRRKLQKALKLIRKKLKEKGIELSDI